MSLSSGSRIGPYEVLAPLGAGGMGEVYRARDTRLNRDVALKVLPDAFALDSERLSRFKREAQVLAALNHPHIAAIHGIEDAGGVHALVLELVEGPTLADRIANGRIPLDEALPPRTYDVAPDGRFLMIEQTPSHLTQRLAVVLNWFEELRRRVPAP